MTCPECNGEMVQGRVYVSDFGTLTLPWDTHWLQFSSQRGKEAVVLGPGDDPHAFRCEGCGTLVLKGKPTPA